MAWLLPILLIVFGAIVYFIIFPAHFDGNMSNMINNTKAQLTTLGQAVPSDSEIKSMLIFQMASSILIAPIANFIPCLGEELGWRGYLLPNFLERYSPIKATLISGIIWGIWHAPMIAMGHNYGLSYPTVPWGGILAMIIFCIFVGSLLAYLTLETKSCIPAAIGHAMVNGFAGIGMMFSAIKNPNLFIGPMPIGIIGGIGIIVGGIICFKIISKMNIANEEYNC